MKRSTAILVTALVAVALVIGTMSLLGPRMGDSFSNIVNSLPNRSETAPQAAMQPGYFADQTSLETDIDGDGRFNQVAQTGQQDIEQQDRLVIRNATLTLVVDDPDVKLREISTLASEFGGWVVSANAYRSGTGEESRVTSASITIRVVADRLDEALERIKTGVQSVDYENVTGQDVTQQYVDLNSSLTNLRAAEEQLQVIMDSARRTEDVLSVYNQLVNIRGQIEQIQGQIQYFEESAAYSSIQVSLTPTPITQPIEIAGWRPQETARDAFQAFVNLLQGIADVGITVAVFGLPTLLVFGLPAWLIYRRWRRSRSIAPQAS
jgi:hypothetical protein